MSYGCLLRRCVSVRAMLLVHCHVTGTHILLVTPVLFLLRVKCLL